MEVFGTDYDGVITNIEPEKAEIFAITINKYWDVDKEEARKYWLATGGISRKLKFNFFYNKQYNKDLSQDEYSGIEQEFREILRTDFYPKLELAPGIVEVLKFVREQFHHTFLSSGMPLDEIIYLTSLHGIDNYFDVILGTNEQFPSKREHFQEIKTRWNISKFVFVGDSVSDMHTAKEANATTIGVTTNHSSEKLLESGADKVCSLTQLKTTISSII